MITKKDLCINKIKEVIEGRCIDYIPDWYDHHKGISTEHLNALKKYVYASSGLAVALEYLLDLKNTDPTLYEYTSQRGGHFILSIDLDREEDDRFRSMSFRELLNLLPEEL